MVGQRPIAFDDNANDDGFTEFWTLAELSEQDFSLPDDIVPGLFSRNLNMIQGPSAAGKSIIATELATAYATNTKFLGKFDVNVNPERPNVCYVDQDTFNLKKVRDRFLEFHCDPEKLSIPKFWLRLDDEKSVSKLVRYLDHFNVGLLILDSIHAFHKLRDKRNLEHLRDGFREIIAAETAIVVLSHITKGSSASDIDAARGFGLIEATDYTHGVSKEAGKIRISNVKSRYGPQSEPFLVTHSGQNRPVEDQPISLADLIVKHLLSVGESGTTISALRKAVPGDDHAISNLVKTLPEVYCDGKRGPGSHLWHVSYKHEEPDSHEIDTILDDSGEDSPEDSRGSFIEFDDDDSAYGVPA